MPASIHRTSADRPSTSTQSSFTNQPESTTSASSTKSGRNPLLKALKAPFQGWSTSLLAAKEDLDDEYNFASGRRRGADYNFPSVGRRGSEE
ncbi:uncharacterized protein BDZ99DRAFT_457742 [Mytilinidion resinicola]|uniref:Uncharacterized protein n=1 Tax=Mytilinidion resinicola TaxID=574789 RepID=A0A6A6Z6A0_9PEZI|nr:uncharacterized protein BDZ99DRAFT_457742 [Mytilinidion resinicola]KAF2815787.1 hypothetical protein BDZ99DRAFT_457742 [Mytilinidion resinicola]